jgi:UDP-N-acetylglucosamine 3-dehydrogenase
VNLALAHQALVDGDFGEPLAFIARLNNPITEARRAADHVSPILHVMIHLLDLAQWFLQQTPRRVTTSQARGQVHREWSVPDGCVVNIEYERGALAVLESFWCLPEAYADWVSPASWNPWQSDWAVEVIGTAGVMYVGGAGPMLRACNTTGWKFPQPTLRPTVGAELGGALRAEVDHFLRCCSEGATPLVDGHAGLGALELALAAEESLATRDTIILNGVSGRR